MRDEVRGNRTAWDAMSPRYQARHGQQLDLPLVWGAFAVPECEVGALGDVADDLVEIRPGPAATSTYTADLEWAAPLAYGGAVGRDQTGRIRRCLRSMSGRSTAGNGPKPVTPRQYC